MKIMRRRLKKSKENICMLLKKRLYLSLKKIKLKSVLSKSNNKLKPMKKKFKNSITFPPNHNYSPNPNPNLNPIQP